MTESALFEWLDNYNFDNGIEEPCQRAKEADVSSRYLKRLNSLLSADAYYLSDQSSKFRKKNPEWKEIQYLERAIISNHKHAGNIDPLYREGSVLDYEDYKKLPYPQLQLRKPLILDLPGFISEANALILPQIEKTKATFYEDQSKYGKPLMATLQKGVRKILSYYFPFNFCLELLNDGRSYLEQYQLSKEYLPYFIDLITEVEQRLQTQQSIKKLCKDQSDFWGVIDTIEKDGLKLSTEEIQYVSFLFGKGGAYISGVSTLDFDRLKRMFKQFHAAHFTHIELSVQDDPIFRKKQIDHRDRI